MQLNHKDMFIFGQNEKAGVTESCVTFYLLDSTEKSEKAYSNSNKKIS